MVCPKFLVLLGGRTGCINTVSAISFIAFAAFADPYTCHVPTCCASLSRVSLNLAASLVFPRDKVTFSSPDVGAVKFSLGTNAVLPLDACAPRCCWSRQAFPILLFQGLLLPDLLFLDLLLLLDLLLFFTFALAGLASAGLAFCWICFLGGLAFLFYLFGLHFCQIMLMKTYFRACSNINMRKI